ncbi:phytanoyl-CoA dioxygenase [Aureococcus anophagefferens]|nr:phytanoyl-CoA dioxygenase [Aureococcus anophagefferens]
MLWQQSAITLFFVMMSAAGPLLTALLALSLVRVAAYDVEAAGASFRRDGFAVLEGFAGADEVAAMKDAMAELEAGYWASPQAAQATVFRTDAGQSGAQAQSRYFFDSADATHFFEEPDGKRLNKAATRYTSGATPSAPTAGAPRSRPCSAPSATDAGTLVVFAGTLDHLSLPNTSPLPRHTFQLHVVESAGVAWHASNWLQTARPGGFLALGAESGEL